MILLFLLSSCAYPDIDTVPDFKDVIIKDEDLIDLCKLKNPYISPTKVKELIYVVPGPTYKYILINNNYKRLKCFERIVMNINRYGL